MAIFTKVKIGIIVLSLFILTAIPLVKNNFYKKPVNSRWKTLTWDDFQGIPKPFSGWDASISSNIYLKYDSLDSSWEAYSSMNKTYSWSRWGSESLLKHEQYHFNISELHARKLSQYIANNPNLDSKDYYKQLYVLRNEREKMQSTYDRQADHSLIKDQQALWEYRVDSMLAVYNSEDRFTVDPFSNGRVFFPDDPTLSVFSEDGTAYRTYVVEKYGMQLRMHSSIGSGPLNLESLKLDIENSLSLRILDSSRNHFQASFMHLDSANNSKVNFLVTYNGYQLIELITKEPLKDSLGGYKEITNSFFQSFSIKDQSEFWKSQVDLTALMILSGVLKKQDAGYEEGRCLVRYYDEAYGFHAVPFLDSDSNIIIPYQFISDSIPEIQNGIVMYGDEIIYSKPDSSVHLFVIPKKMTDYDIGEFTIGYSVFKDTVEVCEQNYSQILSIKHLFLP
jgi:hypothetical protein